LTLTVFITSVALLPRTAATQTVASSESSQGSIQDQWERVVDLRLDGKYDQAIDVLLEIIVDYSESEQILRQAYNHLLFTYLVKDDSAGAEQTAREALERFPDIKADEVLFRPEVNETYNRLRADMYGSLRITKPDDARVFLDGEFKGNTPLQLPFVPVGEHDLTVTKSGYHDYTDRIAIKPATPETLALSLDRTRGTWWWITRVGVVVATAGLVALAVGGGDDGGEEEQEQPPLPDPPDPPASPAN